MLRVRVPKKAEILLAGVEVASFLRVLRLVLCLILMVKGVPSFFLYVCCNVAA